MADAKHTPGPWEVEYLQGRPRGAIQVEGRRGLFAHDRSRDELDANARLIATAPDYDAAARDIADNAEAIVDMPNGKVRSYIITLAQMNALRAAIARATGAA